MILSVLQPDVDRVMASTTRAEVSTSRQNQAGADLIFKKLQIVLCKIKFFFRGVGFLFSNFMVLFF